HSLLVEQIVTVLRPAADRKLLLLTLLHDAPEYVIGDMISPFKQVLGGDYKAVEARLQAAIHMRYGLPSDMPQTTKKLIKRADMIAAFYEATHLAGFSVKEATTFFGRPNGVSPDHLYLKPISTAQAQAAFLGRFAQLENLSARVDV
ncbi:MAG: YfbR-like 5'-deoxynucleotidase, partial [Pseudomonadota bacterium]